MAIFINVNRFYKAYILQCTVFTVRTIERIKPIIIISINILLLYRPI